MALLHMTQLGFDGPATFAAGKTYHGTSGDDAKSGTARDDIFNFGQGGNDTLNGLAGNDTFNLGATFTPNDRIDGGKGFDTLVLNGNYLSVGQPQFEPDTIHNIEAIRVTAGFDYYVGVRNENVAAGKTLTIDGSALGSNDRLLTSVSGDLDSFFVFTGGLGADSLSGGGKADHLTGVGGDDELAGFGGGDIETGGAGHDTFTIIGVSESTGKAHDVVTDFDAAKDIFNLGVAVAAVDSTVDGGGLSPETFNHDLGAAIGKHELHAGDAVLFVPHKGTLAGHVFLIVDGNGHAGYQANQDFVVDITGAAHLGQLGTDNFINDIG